MIIAILTITAAEVIGSLIGVISEGRLEGGVGAGAGDPADTLLGVDVTGAGGADDAGGGEGGSGGVLIRSDLSRKS